MMAILALREVLRITPSGVEESKDIVVDWQALARERHIFRKRRGFRHVRGLDWTAENQAKPSPGVLLKFFPSPKDQLERRGGCVAQFL